MKIFAAGILSLLLYSCSPLGYPVNEGREYGNPSMPWMVSHIPARNQVILTKTRTPHHHIFNRILCFKRGCRITIGRQKSLRPITFETFKKRIAKNAKKGIYQYKRDTISRPSKKPVVKQDTSKVIAKAFEPVAVPKEVSERVLKTDSLITLSDVLFETNSATLKSEHFQDLASVIDFMLAHTSVVIKISGHTDNTGTIVHNRALSFKRAEVVAEYLIDNGIAVERVSFEGLGSSKPLMPNGTEAGRAKNRRVELLLHDKTQR